MKRLLSAAILLLCAPLASARPDLYPQHSAEGTSDGNKLRPVYDKDKGTYTWNNPPWTDNTADPAKTPLGSILAKTDSVIALGMDNIYVEANYKLWTVEFDYEIGTKGSKPVPHLPTAGSLGNKWGSIKESEESSDGHFKGVYRIQPQPAWEYMTFDVTANTLIKNIQMSSVCLPIVPTPGAIGLSIAAGLVSTRRARRAL